MPQVEEKSLVSQLVNTFFPGLCLFAEVAMICYWAMLNSGELMTICSFVSHQISDGYSLVSNYARHTWDVPISVLNASYLKVSTYLGIYISDMQNLNSK